ncbi:MAG: RAD52 family DNA repair protein [Pseudomonadota bacterium]
MTVSDVQTAELSKKLHPQYVKQRDGNDYIESWAAIHRANSIFGFDGWSSETVSSEIVSRQQRGDKKWEIVCTAKVRVHALGTFHEGTGVGDNIQGSLAKALNTALKDAESDAMKRALRQFGNQFGNALYDKAKRFVGVDKTPEPPVEPAANDAPNFLPTVPPDDLVPGMIDALIEEVHLSGAQTDLDNLAKTWGKYVQRCSSGDQKRVSEAFRAQRNSVAAMVAAE